MRSTILPICALALAVAVPATAATNPLHAALGAPENWKIAGSVRMRLEGIDGQFRPNLPPDDALLSFRTTLFAEYDTGPVRIGGELFDSRGYLERRRTSVTTSEVNALELAQAYLGFDLGAALGAGSTTTLTAGRFTMDNGSRRLVARNQFRNTSNAFTGLRLDWQGQNRDQLRLFYVLPHVRLPTEPEKVRDNAVEWDRESLALRFFGGSFTRAGVAGGTLELFAYGLQERDTPALPTRNRRLATPGARLFRAPGAGRLDWDVEGAGQFGRVRVTAAAADRRDLDVSATFLHAEVGRTFAARWSPRIVLQYDRASGDRRGAGSFNRFDTLFGSRRADFGPTSLYGALQRANLSSPAVRLEVTPDARLDAFLGYRALWLVSASDSFATTGVRDAGGRSGKFAGNQLESRLRYWLAPGLARLDTGVALLFRGRFLRDAPNAPANGTTRFGYMDVTFTF